MKIELTEQFTANEKFILGVFVFFVAVNVIAYYVIELLGVMKWNLKLVLICQMDQVIM